MDGAQAIMPFDAEELAYIAALDARADCDLLSRELPALRPECGRTLQVSTALLQAAAAGGLRCRPSAPLPQTLDSTSAAFDLSAFMTALSCSCLRAGGLFSSLGSISKELEESILSQGCALDGRGVLFQLPEWWKLVLGS